MAHRVRDEHDGLILFLQDHIRPKEFSFGLGDDSRVSWYRLKEFIQATNLPLFITSVGVQGHDQSPSELVQTLDPLLIDFLRFASTVSSEIGVRGQISQDVLNLLGITNSVPIGCPSFFLNGENQPNAFSDASELKRTCVKGTRVLLTSPLRLGRSWAKIKPQFSPVVLQSEREVLFGLLTGSAESHSTRAMISSNPQGFLFFTDPRQWIKELGKWDLGLGSRFHGAVAAIHGGTPTLVISGDMRTRELSDLLGLPRLTPEELRSKNPSDVLSLIYEAFDSRKNTVRYSKLWESWVSLLHKNGLELANSGESSIESLGLTFSNPWHNPRELKRKWDYSHGDELLTKASNVARRLSRWGDLPRG